VKASIYIQVLLFLATSFLMAGEARAITPKPRLSDDEVLTRFRRKKNNQISDHTISATAIEKVLAWAQKEAAAGRGDSLGTFSLANCIVTGSVDFEKLRTTSIDTLPQDLQKRLKSNVEKVALIPVLIDIQQTVFQSEVDSLDGAEFLNEDFSDVVFQKDVAFLDSVFEQSVTFDDCVFQEGVQFRDTSFKEFAGFEDVDFQERADFSNAQFKGRADFVHAEFNGGAQFGGAKFQGRADFAGATFLSTSTFVWASFAEIVSFNQANIEGEVQFVKNKFPATVFFTNINRIEVSKGHGIIIFRDVSFHERTYFTGTNLQALWFSFVPEGGVPRRARPRRLEQNLFTPVTFEKYATFRGLECVNAGFIDVEFRDFVDFGDAKFKNSVSFAGSTFEKDTSFYRSEFPFASAPSTTEPDRATPVAIPTGLFLDHVRFQKPVTFEWEQLKGRLSTTDKATWELLENSFKQSGNLEGQNEAMYQRRILEREASQGWTKRVKRLEYYFWGYGVRPLRVTLWILLFYLFFTALYWTQTGAMKLERSKWWGRWQRLTFVVDFSARTSWKWLYGYENARTPLFKVLTVIHSLGFKVLLFFLLKAFSNTSPLLNELVGKLVRL
jgi:uncharacterized protein YjbI with pentapeptide repeats